MTLNTTKLLEQAGLSAREALVYAAALRLGSGTADDISHAAKLTRTTTKSILERLRGMGYVSLQTARRKHVYWAEGAEVVVQKERLRIAALEDVLKTIGTEFHTADKKPQTEVFDTRASIVTLVTRAIAESGRNDEILTFEAPNAVNYQSVMGDELFLALAKEREAKGIRTRSLIPAGHEKSVRPKALQYNVQVRVLPPELSYATSTWIFGSSIVLFSGSQTFAVLIKHPDMAHTFRNLFEFMWTAATPLRK